MNHYRLADLLLSHVIAVPEDILREYPPRHLSPNAKVTRFAPSPTGLLHIGGLYAALVSERLAHQNNGIFYLRLEDTDKKRELEGSISNIINSLNYFGIRFDEGLTILGNETGSYGPYTQSARKEIYQIFVKHLIREGFAYPCFCSAEELNNLRRQQEQEKANIGYYGKWALHRNMSIQEVTKLVDLGAPYVIRLKSPGSGKTIAYIDLIKGSLELPENEQDIVIMKSDGLPTYHFAHVIDDYLMRTTHVLRGDEWLSSVPVHLQLFDVLGFQRPEYGHIAPILKQVGATKRKFSKRKDMDGHVSYYLAEGFPKPVIIEYFMHLINSNFEEWRMGHPDDPIDHFTVKISRMNVSGALLDMARLTDISKNMISKLSANDIYSQVTEWAEQFDPAFYEQLCGAKEYAINIFQIGRNSDKPRKDISKWVEVLPSVGYFYNTWFYETVMNGYQLPADISLETALRIASAFKASYDHNSDQTIWFHKIMEIAANLGFAQTLKLYKTNPQGYRGHVGDISMILRVILTNQRNTPELYEIMQVMGESRVNERLEYFIKRFS